VQVGDKIKRIKTKVQVLINQLEILHINQSGDDNYGKQDQMGSLNDALIDQFGDDNTQQTKQTGSLNCNLSSWR
jgi:hypothetical protein